MNRLLRTLVDRPFESWMAVLSPIGGTIQLGASTYPPSIQNTVGETLAAIWCFFLLAGGLALLAGLLFNRFASQRLGCTILATACAVYAVAVLSYGGIGYLLGAGFLVVLGLGLVTRAVTLRHAARRGC